MREIKFRAWDKKGKYMGKVFSLEDASYEGFPRPFTDDNGECDTRAEYVVMQFTGLKDKNGKDIYEGDIVKNNDEVWDLYYDEGAWKMGLKGKRTNNDHLFLLEPQHSKILGNIYENPELLSNKNK